MPTLRVLVPALSALLMSACVMVPYPQHRPEPYRAYGEPVASADVPPPAPYVEVVPVVPFVGAVWLSGHWGWGGGRHHWVGGRWERPRAGFIWSPHQWMPHHGRWHLRGGGWTRH